MGEAGEPAVVEGVKGTWRVDPSQLGQPFSGRAALLSPFDRLIHDRKRTVELFEFDYQLEMYKPAAKRRWGYFALPILYGDRLVGKLDATADRKAGVLRVNAIHQDVPFNKAMTAAVDREIKDLARWLELDLKLPERTLKPWEKVGWVMQTSFDGPGPSFVNLCGTPGGAMTMSPGPAVERSSASWKVSFPSRTTQVRRRGGGEARTVTGLAPRRGSARSSPRARRLRGFRS